MLCDICLGVLQDCQNIIESREDWYFPDELDIHIASNNEWHNAIDSQAEGYVRNDTHENDNDGDDVIRADDGTECNTSSRAATERDGSMQVGKFVTSSDVGASSGSGLSHGRRVESDSGTPSFGMTTSTTSTSNEKEASDHPVFPDSQSASSKHSSSDADPIFGERHAMYGHHVSFSSLQEAARIGCQICWQVNEFWSRGGHQSAASTSKIESTAELNSSRFVTFAIVNRRLESFDVEICMLGLDTYAGCEFRFYPETSAYTCFHATKHS